MGRECCGRIKVLLLMLAVLVLSPRAATAQSARSYLLKPAAVFDGANAPHSGWAVLVKGERIVAAGPLGEVGIPSGTEIIDLPGLTLLPGLIDLHTHLLLHPYNEALWDDQVLKEPFTVRVARAVAAARSTLMAGFTTLRDLGTEGAGYADVGLKQAIDQGVVPGPRLVVVTRAIVATGSYGPKGFDPGRARSDRQGRRLDQSLRRLPLGTERRGATHLFAVRIKRDRRGGPQQRPARRRPRHPS